MSGRRSETPLVALSARVYRVLLLRYPRRLRARYGAHMVAAFRELLRDERARPGGGRLRWLVRAWRRVIADMLRPLPGALGRGPQPGSGRPAMGAARWWVRLGEDVLSAARSLRREPRFTLLLVGVLGVGIAFAAAVFAVVNAYLLRPLPYPEPGRLVDVRPPSTVGWRDVGAVFEKAVSWDLDAFTIVGGGDPELAMGAWVTPDFFDLYGVRPALGRALLPQDAVEGGSAVALVSHRLWVERWGADPGVLGRTFRAFTSDRPDDAETFTIVGVLPAGFWHFNTYTDVLAPLRVDQAVYSGRLRADVPPARAEAVLTEMAIAGAAGDVPEGFRVTARPVQEGYTAAIRPRLWVLQSAALLVLLIACANAAVLLLVRAAGRRTELGVRRALGAGESRLATQLLSEGLLLAGAAGALGLVLGATGLDVAGELIPERLGRRVPGGPEAFRLDATVVLATTGITALVGGALGAVTLWVTRRRDVAGVLIGAGRGGVEAPGSRRARSGLVAIELALSLTLLTGAGLLVRSALHLHRVDLGFDPVGLLKGTVGLPQGTYAAEADRLAFFESLIRGTARLPGVESAALVMPAPFVGTRTGSRIEAEDGGGGAGVIEGAQQVVSPEYFPTMGLDVVRGRGFSADDGPGASRVAVVSASLADRLWGRGDALGRRLRPAGTPSMSGPDDGAPGAWLTVVGVVGDVTQWAGDDVGELYVPLAQSPSFWTSVVARHRSSAAAVAEGVEGVLRDLDAEVPFYAIADVGEAVELAGAPSRFMAALLAGFALFAATLAVVGVYGVVAYAVRQRRRDVAIRVALGAGGGAVQGLFVRQTAGVVAAGLVAGVAGGRALGRALEGLLYGVGPGDPGTTAAVTGVLALTTLVAMWLPARAAAGADPMDVLREE